MESKVAISDDSSEFPVPEVLYCLRGDGYVEPLYKWTPPSNPQVPLQSNLPSVVIIHDLWEDIGFYKKEILWWLSQGRQVFAFQVDYYGTKKRSRFAGTFEKVCYNFLQVFSMVRSLDSMRAPLVYTRGVGALITTQIARKNSKFLSGMIAVAPLYNLKAPPKGIWDALLTALSAFSPDWLLPPVLTLRMSEQRWISVARKRNSILAPPDVSSPEMSQWQKQFHFESLQDWQRFSSSKPCKKLSEARMTCKALSEYLRAMKKSAKICSRLKRPCLFLLPKSSHYLDYQVLYKVQKKYGAMMRFEIQKVVDIEAVTGYQEPSNFSDFADQYILPWLSDIMSSHPLEEMDHSLSEANMLEEGLTSTTLSSSSELSAP